jgi:hypothetical protein
MNVASTRSVTCRAAVAESPTRRKCAATAETHEALVSLTAVAYGSRPKRPSAAASTYKR